MPDTRGCRKLFVGIWSGGDLDAFVFTESRLNHRFDT